MKTIYLDSDYRCHLENADGRTAHETDLFDGYAPEVIEGYRLVPAGQSWTRADGKRFSGLMVAPWKDSRVLETIQREYERERYQEAIAAVDTLLLQMGGAV